MNQKTWNSNTYDSYYLQFSSGNIACGLYIKKDFKSTLVRDLPVSLWFHQVNTINLIDTAHKANIWQLSFLSTNIIQVIKILIMNCIFMVLFRWINQLQFEHLLSSVLVCVSIHYNHNRRKHINEYDSRNILDQFKSWII